MPAYRVSATRAVREFSELLRRAGDGGQEVLIERHHKPVARLSPAGLSPVRWVDFMRHLRRNRSPDSGFAADLARSRGLDRSSAGRYRHPLELGTILLDAPLLVDANRYPHCLDSLQRVATTSAALAELLSIAGSRGPYIEEVRRMYVQRVASVIPVVSFNQPAAFAVGSQALAPGDQGRPETWRVFDQLARATARALDWPLVGVSGATYASGSAPPAPSGR